MNAQDLNSLVIRLAGANRTRILGRDEERDAAMAWKENRDETARLLIVQTHVKLVAKEVRRLRHYKADPLDLMSEGMIGLSIALDKFDPDAGFRFSTYAIHWIRAKLLEHVLQTEGVMRISNSQKQKRMLFGYRKAKADLAKKARNSGQELTIDALRSQVAERLDVSVEDLVQFEAAIGHANSLEAPTSPNGEGQPQTLADILPDQSPIAEDMLADIQRKTRLRGDVVSALSKLNAREQDIILRRKLAPEGEGMTLEDLSQIYGVSRERIRQVEVVALKKLEKSLAPTRALLEAA